MKLIKITSLFFVLLLSQLSCRDEAKNPTLDPEFGAYAKGQFLDASNNEIPSTFGAYSQTAVNAAIFWNKANTNESTATTSVKGQLVWNAGKETVIISQIEIYVQFIESYSDKGNNIVTKRHGPAASPTTPEGKLWKTLSAAARLSPTQFTITPADVYNLYKGTKFDYKGTGTAVDIFEANPGTVRTQNAVTNLTGNRFYPTRTDKSVAPVDAKTLAADQISLRWRLIASDGRTFGSFGNNVCTQLIDANCNVLFIVK